MNSEYGWKLQPNFRGLSLTLMETGGGGHKDIRDVIDAYLRDFMGGC